MDIKISKKEYWTIFDCLQVFKEFAPEFTDDLKKKFERFDKNQNGFIEGNELNHLAKDYAEKLYGQEFKMKLIVRRSIIAQDTNLEKKENVKIAEKGAAKILEDFGKTADQRLNFDDFKKIIIKVAMKFLTNQNLTKDQFLSQIKQLSQAVTEFTQKNNIEQVLKAKHPFAMEEKEDDYIVIGNDTFETYHSLSGLCLELLGYLFEEIMDDNERKEDVEKHPENYMNKFGNFKSFLEGIVKFLEELKE